MTVLVSKRASNFYDCHSDDPVLPGALRQHSGYDDNKDNSSLTYLGNVNIGSIQTRELPITHVASFGEQAFLDRLFYLLLSAVMMIVVVVMYGVDLRAEWIISSPFRLVYKFCLYRLLYRLTKPLHKKSR